MAGFIMGGGVLLAILFVVAKKVMHKRQVYLSQHAPGFSFENPLELSDFSDVNAFVRRTDCVHCKGDLRAMGEDTAQVKGKILHVVRTRCEKCDETQALIFDIGGLPN